MGFLLLGLGIALWWAAHLFKRMMPERRAAMGAAGRGPIALAIVASVVLMVIGFRATDTIQIWYPPSFLIHVNNLLMLIALFLTSPAAKKGKVIHGMRHPMLAGFKTWAIAHLLVNGDLASIFMFGSLLAWAVVSVIVINRSEPNWSAGEPGSYKMDAIFLAASVVLMGVIGFIHTWLGYWPFAQ